MIQLPKVTKKYCIYLITYTLYGEEYKYVGMTSNLARRMGTHNKHKGKLLKCVILEEGDDVNVVSDLEQYWIAELRPTLFKQCKARYPIKQKKVKKVKKLTDKVEVTHSITITVNGKEVYHG